MTCSAIEREAMSRHQFTLREMLLMVAVAALYFASLGYGFRGGPREVLVPFAIVGHMPMAFLAIWALLDRKRALRRAGSRYLDLPIRFPRFYFALPVVGSAACAALIQLGYLPQPTILVATPMFIGIIIFFRLNRMAFLCSGGVVFLGHAFPWGLMFPIRNTHGELEFLRFGTVRGAWRAIVPPVLREPVEAILRQHAP
jgi:hypothetical protein